MLLLVAGLLGGIRAECSCPDGLCEVGCACPNRSSSCQSHCCYRDVCEGPAVCEEVLKPWVVVGIVVAVLGVVVILLCVAAVCCGVCRWVLCCCRDSSESSRSDIYHF